MTLVLLDLDGTLLDGSGLPAAMRAACDAVVAGLPAVSAEDLVAANTAAWQRLWPDVEDDYMLGGRPGDDIGEEVWRESLAACGVHDGAVLALAVATWKRQERAAFRLFDDVLPTLDALDAAGIAAGMVTNGSAAVQRLKLESVGLLRRFDPLVISSEAGVRKPDPGIFEIALAQAHVGPEAVVFVGDNRWHDLPGATAVGVRAVWLDRAGVGLEAGGPVPDATIRTLTELLPLLG